MAGEQLEQGWRLWLSLVPPSPHGVQHFSFPHRAHGKAKERLKLQSTSSHTQEISKKKYILWCRRTCPQEPDPPESPTPWQGAHLHLSLQNSPAPGALERPQDGTAALGWDLGTGKQKLQLVELKQLLPALLQQESAPRNQLGVSCLQQPPSAREPTF